MNSKWMKLGLGIMFASALAFSEEAKPADGKGVVSEKAISTGMSAECQKAMAEKNMGDCPRHSGAAMEKDCPKNADGSMNTKDCPKHDGHCAKCAKKHQHDAKKTESKTETPAAPSLSGEPPAAGSTVTPTEKSEGHDAHK